MSDTILVGIKKFVSKEGKPYATLQTVTPFRNEDKANGCLGRRVEEVFCSDSLLPQLATLELDKPIRLDYDVINGRAYLIGFATVKGDK